MSLRTNFFSLVVPILAAAVVARGEVKVGDTFPALAANGVVNLATGDVPATAGKVTLVDFWASWCAPCKASFPAMAKLHSEFAPRGFQIVAVSIDEKPAAATAFWKKLAPPFAAVHDREQKLVRQVVVPTMPTSYLLDRTGKVRFVHEGFHGDASERDLRNEIAAVLAEK
jgi:thiol-disulfide isomerase/thioredoxin